MKEEDMSNEVLARIDAGLAHRVNAYLESSVTAPTSRALINDLLAALLSESAAGEARLEATKEALKEAIRNNSRINQAYQYQLRRNILFHDEIVRLSALIPEPPTDDEREALSRIIDAVDEGTVTGQFERWENIFPQERDQIVEAILASPVWRNRYRGPITAEAAEAAR